MSSKSKTTATKEVAKPALVPKLRFPEFRGAALRIVRLGDVTEEGRSRNGNKHSIASVMGVTKADGIVPMEARLIAADIERYKLVENDWFAYNPMRLNIGSIARWKGESEILVSPDYVVFKCITDDESGIAPSYLDHFRQTKAWEEFVTEGGDGSVRVRIYYKDVARIGLVLPTLSEQQKIAECLSSVDALVDAQAEKVNALKFHKKGLMQQLFPREGEIQPHLRFPGFKGEWNHATLGELCFSVSSGKDARESDGEFDLYGSTGVIGKTVTASYATPQLLVARVGANAGHLTKASGQFGVTDNTLVISLKSAATIDYIFHYLGNIDINKLIFGSGQPLITGSILKAQRVLIPSISEQRKISTCLSSIEDLINVESKKMEALKDYKKGLMQKLFPSAEELEG